jgi:hypothetical protein
MLFRNETSLTSFHPIASSIGGVLKREISLVAVALAAQILLRVPVRNMVPDLKM